MKNIIKYTFSSTVTKNSKFYINTYPFEFSLEPNAFTIQDIRFREL